MTSTSPTPQQEPRYIMAGEEGSQRRIATLHRKAAPGGPFADAPGIMWMQGFKSEMISTKAAALDVWTAQRGLQLTRFDYSGHGQSAGNFEEGTIGDWLADSEAVFRQIAQGPQILVGSSMGGWLALLLLRRLMASDPEQAARIKALVLIAPAWDMTETLMWQQFPETVRRQVIETGRFERQSDYGDGPYVITRKLIEEGRAHLIGPDAFDPGRPVLILHGLLDPDVPWEHSMELESLLHGDRVRIVMVPDGEHRLSRPQDLEQLFGLIEGALSGAADSRAR